jgi:hypothetical protein
MDGSVLQYAAFALRDEVVEIQLIPPFAADFIDTKL